MVVDVDKIKEGGLKLDEPISPALLDAALTENGPDTGFRAVDPGTLHASLRKVSRGVILDGSFEFVVTAPCKRCIVDVECRFPVQFELNLIPKSLYEADRAAEKGEDDEAAEVGGTFNLEKADEDVFDGKTIDLDPIVREQVLLALPMNVVCREDCKGLCPVCGQNLNEKKCACETKVVDPRLAALKNIKLS